MFCEVERSYIEDGFNLYGLRACVSNFSDCLDLILDRIGPDDDSDDSHLTQSACTLYGLIHARYIITAHGLDAMYSKVGYRCILNCKSICTFGCRISIANLPTSHFVLQYAAKEFGTCPLVQCAGQPVLPVSLKDEMGADTVKTYCPKCSQVYHPPPVRSRTGNASGVDGSAFGTTFPHLFLMTFSNLVPDPLPIDSTYIPRVFGFRVHKSARQRFSPPAALPASTTSTRAAAAVETTKKQSAEDDEVSKSPPALEHSNGNVVAIKTDAGTAAAAEAAEPGPPALAAADEKRSPTRAGTKRKNNGGPSSTNTDGAVAPPDPAAARKETALNGGGGTAGAVPTFLMENPVKRRRRTNNNST